MKALLYKCVQAHIIAWTTIVSASSSAIGIPLSLSSLLFIYPHYSRSIHRARIYGQHAVVELYTHAWQRHGDDEWYTSPAAEAARRAAAYG